MKSSTYETNAAGAEVLKEWEALQHYWWQALQAGAKQFSPPVSAIFGDPLARFNDLFEYQPNGLNTPVLDRFLAGNKQFLAWIQNFSSQMSALSHVPIKVEDWSTFFKKVADSMLQAKNPFLDLFQGMAAHSLPGVDQVFSAVQNPAETLKGEIKNLLAMPAFGYSREPQERAQRLAAATIAWQEAQAAYHAALLQASRLSLEKMQLKLAEREEPGRQLDSLRAIYDLWIDAAEEAYAEIALSTEFQGVYGNLVNQQMVLQQLLNAEVERSTAQLGMPTRSELNSVHQRLQDVRRRFREFEDRLENIDSTAPTAKPAKSNDEGSKLPKVKAKTAIASQTLSKQTIPISDKSKLTAAKASVKKSKSGKSSKTKSIAAKRAFARLA